MHKPATPWPAGSTIVVKFGGNAMAPDAEEALFTEVALLRAAGVRVVLVHGGGPQIDAELAAQGIVTERIDGQRVTTAQTLAITEAVLCGLINPRLVDDLQALGVPAVGMSGKDDGMLTCDRRLPESLGYVGAIRTVAPDAILAHLAANVVPVIAPIGTAADFSTTYNINADEAAGAIAEGIKADALVFLTNVDRVRRNESDASTGIDRMTDEEAWNFADSDACTGSMKPKVRAAAQAVRGGVGCSIIARFLGRQLTTGTRIVRDQGAERFE